VGQASRPARVLQDPLLLKVFMKKIGILALQGDFEAHGRTLAAWAPIPSSCAPPPISTRSMA
jgi:hypothetical protein